MRIKSTTQKQKLQYTYTNKKEAVSIKTQPLISYYFYSIANVIDGLCHCALLVVCVAHARVPLVGVEPLRDVP